MSAATRLTDSSDKGVADARVSRDAMTDPPAVVATSLPDGAELETRHRLRRALRILTAARRRDDGGVERTDA